MQRWAVEKMGTWSEAARLTGVAREDLARDHYVRLCGPQHKYILTSSLFRKIFKPVGACSAYIKASLFFPGHFVPAPFFNEGTSLIGI